MRSILKRPADSVSLDAVVPKRVKFADEDDDVTPDLLANRALEQLRSAPLHLYVPDDPSSDSDGESQDESSSDPGQEEGERLLTFDDETDDADLKPLLRTRDQPPLFFSPQDPAQKEAMLNAMFPIPPLKQPNLPAVPAKELATPIADHLEDRAQPMTLDSLPARLDRQLPYLLTLIDLQDHLLQPDKTSKRAKMDKHQLNTILLEQTTEWNTKIFSDAKRHVTAILNMDDSLPEAQKAQILDYMYAFADMMGVKLP